MEQDLNRITKKCHDIFEVCASEKELMTSYDDWAKDYEGHMKLSKYSVPRRVAPVLMQYLKPGPDISILDIACGTGLLGQYLREEKFVGKLHGLDGSQEMLKVAREKGMYDELFNQILFPGEPINAAPNVKYDAISCIGAIMKNHLNPKIVFDFLGLLKSGGAMFIIILDSWYNVAVNAEVTQIFKGLEERGKVQGFELIKVSNALNVEDRDVPEDYGAETFPKMTANIYRCRKL